jgi:hypothetical protein
LIDIIQVVSPFQAILDYEIENQIPIGYINFAIQKGPADTGAWQLIERGECELNDEWFEAFRKQLMRQEVWEDFVKREAGKRKKELRPSEVGRVPHIEAKKLFWRMMRYVLDETARKDSYYLSYTSTSADGA